MDIRTFIGDKSFYKKVFTIAVPIMIQNGITNFVALLDNIMVGQLGTAQMSGTAVVNQLLFVFNLCIFGILAGPGIYGAQFFGKGSSEGVRNTFRFKLYAGLLVLLAGGAILSLFGTELISSYLMGNGEESNKALILQSGLDYLGVMVIGLIPFTVTQIYASTLRETNQTLVPMFAGLTAVLMNLVLDWVLIFGNLGMPKMGVKGAALATVIARFAECIIVVIWTHANSGKNAFIKGAYSSLKIPSDLVKQIIIHGLPLAVNEGLWSSGMALLNRCYSMRGLEVVAATNISSTIFNLFSVIFIALGNSVGIIVGQILGSGDTKKELLARSRYLLFKSGEKWTLSQSKRAEILFREYPDLKTAYGLSHSLRMIFSKNTVKDAARLSMAKWYNKVEEAGFRSFNVIAATFYEHYDDILNFYTNRSSNAAAESFNAKIKAFRASLRGIVDEKFFLYRLAKIYAYPH